MTKTEHFVIARTNENGTQYFGIGSDNQAAFMNSPLDIKTALSHEDATNIVRAMRKKGLAEGETIRAKSLQQCIRNWSWDQIVVSHSIATAEADAVTSVLDEYKVEEKVAEPVAEVETEPVEVTDLETLEEEA